MGVLLGIVHLIASRFWFCVIMCMNWMVAISGSYEIATLCMVIAVMVFEYFLLVVLPLELIFIPLLGTRAGCFNKDAVIMGSSVLIYIIVLHRCLRIVIFLEISE